MTATDALPACDLMGLSTLADPYPLYAQWRAAHPVVKGGPGQWGITRHADVTALLKDRRISHEMPQAYTDFVMGAGPSSAFRQNSLLMMDGEAHVRLRRLMSQAFTPHVVRDLEHRVEALVAELTAPLLDGAVCDIVDLLAFPLPTAVICELMGIPAGDRADVRGHAANLLGADTAASDASVSWMRTYMEDVLRQRCADPDGDLLDRMLAAAAGDDGFSHAEIVDNAILLFFAGFETTRHVLAAGLLALAQHPAQWAVLRAEPDGVCRPAVEELFRYATPVPSLATMALEPIEVGERTIKAGHVLHLLLACANRDEAVFARAEELDVTRVPNPHVTFGGGPHRCLGMHLARLEVAVVLRALAEAVAHLELVGDPRRGTTTFGGYETVVLRARPA